MSQLPHAAEHRFSVRSTATAPPTYDSSIQDMLINADITFSMSQQVDDEQRLREDAPTYPGTALPPPVATTPAQRLTDPTPRVRTTRCGRGNNSADNGVVLSPPGESQTPAPISSLYQFIPSVSDSMILSLCENKNDINTQFHISLGRNVFRPLSQVSTIRRGDSEHGALIGSFELFGAEKHHMGLVSIDGRELLLDDVLRMEYKEHRYDWKFHTNPRLRWFLHSDGHHVRPLYRMACKDVQSGEILAKLMPMKFQIPGREPSPATLRVWTAGQARLEEILISCLVIEGLRRFEPRLHRY
ncbi:hypothetical protein BV22DRAFT_295174 [Leucogyrophana mollusca]|uniref:Uncharacterized protein n=1 Tax=Leucogyrophana mollusca TaxID=85980 RepID=A0ACB8BQV6_9AGAM|nr:hypothetical protein BV22DRAFT_295174 [Leucogyrophana mollusca]